MNENPDTTFVRRKFTITEELDSELEQMADNNYQGNVSLCLRQSICDHRETLNGNGDLTIRHLMESVAHIEDQIENLTESINARNQEPNSSDGRLSVAEGMGVKVEDATGSASKQIISVLEKANSPLRVADIIEIVEIKPSDVRQILGHLIDHGHVFTTSGSPPRYRLAKISPSLNKNENKQRGEDL